MKLSDLYVGDVLKVQDITTFYIVVTSVVWIESLKEEIKYLTIECKRLTTGGRFVSHNYKLNRITPDEVLSDHYDVPKIKKVSNDDLALIINDPHTIWYERALKQEIKGQGLSVYEHLIRILKDA